MGKRYDSPLRQQQQEMTRNRIMEALIDLINEGRIYDFTVRDVAERAGVSYGSVYRHYPTREALLHALGNWAQKLPNVPEVPGTLAEIPAWIRVGMREFETRAETMIAFIGATHALNIRLEGTRRRDEHFMRLIAAEVPGKEEAEVRKVAAVMRHLTNSSAWRAMRVTYGLSGDETADALSWALDVLIQNLKERSQKEERS